MNIDNLEIAIKSQATSAIKALDSLESKLLKVSGTMSTVNGNGIRDMATGIITLSDAVNRIKNIDSRSFTALAKNIDKLSKVNSAGLHTSAIAIGNMSKALGSLQGATDNITNLNSLADAIRHLGYKSVNTAISNMPKLATAMGQLMASLSKAPSVSQNLIDMTNALASLTANGNSFTKVSPGIRNSFGHLVKGASNTSKSFKSLAYYFGKFYANYFLLVRAFSKLKNAIDISSALTEVQNVVNMTFGQMSNKVEDFSKTSISSFGMSELSAKQFASRFQAMGSAMGIPLEGIGKKFDFINTKIDGMNDSVKNLYSATDGITDMSLNLTKLAADMASFYNVSQEDVAKDLESVFTGMTRPLRTYGLDLTQATLQEWALKQGMDVNIKSMTQAQKTMLRYQYVMANADVAMGDFAKTSGTWANQTRMLAENIKALGAVWGTAFINLLKPLITTLNQAMISITNFSVNVINALGQIFGWKVEIQNVGISQDFETADDALEDATGNAKKLKQQLMGIDELNILSDTNTGADGIDMSAGSDLNQKKFDIVETESAFKSAIDSVGKLGEYLSDKLNTILSDINWESIYEKAKNFGTGLAEFLNGLINPETFKTVGKTIANSLKTVVKSVFEFVDTFNWENAGTSIGEGINGFFEESDFKELARTFNKLAKGIETMLKKAFDSISWSTILSGIKDFFDTVDENTITLLIGAYSLKKFGDILTSTIMTRLGAKLVGSTWLYPIALTVGVTVAWGKALSLLERYKNGTALEKAQIEAEWKKNRDQSVQSEKENPKGTADRYAQMEASKRFWENEFPKWLENMDKAIEEIKKGIKAWWDETTIGSFINYWEEEIPKWWEEDVKPWFTKEKWSEEFGNVKTAISESWEDFKSWWNDTVLVKFWDEKVMPKFTKDYWSQKFDTIQQGAKTKWDEVKKWYTDNIYKKFWQDKIQKVFTKEFWNEKFDAIRQGAIEKWEEIKKWWNDTVVGKFWNETISPIFTKEFWLEKWQGFKDGIVEMWGSAIEALKLKWNEFANWMNEKLTFKINTSTLIGEGVAKVLGSDTIKLASIPTFATGGFPGEDGVFMANHNELVGTFSNGQTAVANNMQIVSGIAYGVREAVREELAPYLDRLVTSNDTIARKDLSVNIGDRDIARANLRGTKQMGVQIITA